MNLENRRRHDDPGQKRFSIQGNTATFPFISIEKEKIARQW